MKITVYELLGMVKDGKAPKRIRFLNHYYIWKENDEDYQKEDGLMLFGNIKINYILNDTVEIIEEKKIPEKIEEFGIIQYNLDYIDYKNIEILKEWLNKDFQTIYDTIDLIIKNQNKLIDYLKSKGE